MLEIHLFRRQHDNGGEDHDQEDDKHEGDELTFQPPCQQHLHQQPF